MKTDADDQEGLDSNLDSEAEVTCPYCGEQLTLTLDPDGGLAQEYVEDCPVCCRPWRVQVSYDEAGAAEVVLEQADD
ncbi:MAG TPA: CPXCG motif-containing cysteine-rich protein [Gemmatimonadales bacterium]|nr:CPXCG motif-containing cysteine-rich protein [Gemmatimonadales bacterium]